MKLSITAGAASAASTFTAITPAASSAAIARKIGRNAAVAAGRVIGARMCDSSTQRAGRDEPKLLVTWPNQPPVASAHTMVRACDQIFALARQRGDVRNEGRRNS